jgi:site-specific DNA recombinase
MTISDTGAWVYARRSKRSDDQASVEDQEEHGKAACSEHGWLYRGTVPEEVSASRFGTRARHGWDTLQGMIRGGEIGVLILWESNRGDRTLTTWSAFLDLCRETGTRVYVIGHERLYDLRNRRDWKTLASDGVENADFSEQLSVVTRRGKRSHMAKGRPCGVPPYGYEARYSDRTGKTAGRLVRDDEAEIVREIVRGIGAAHPRNAIARDLNERGIPAPKGGEWSPRTVLYVAGNSVYAGLVRLHDGTYARPQEQADGAKWPPIVTEEDWRAARAVLDSRATGARPGGFEHLLSYLARCDCGGWMRAEGRKRGGKCYVCVRGNNQVPEEWLDEWVTDVICERLARDDAAGLYAADDGPETARLRKELAALRDRRSGFRKRAAAGTISEDALEEIEAELNPGIARLEKRADAVRVVPALAGLIGAADVRAAWDGYTLRAQREVVAAVTGIAVRRVPKSATDAERYDVAARVAFDWQPQPPKRGPGGRQ